MLPPALTAAQFQTYPPQARALAGANLALLRRMPLAFLPSLLRELIDYDWAFPAERASLEGQLALLEGLTAPQFADCFAAFSRLRLTPAQAALDWVNQPFQFTEQLSAYLWSTNQMDAFRAAATAFGDRMRGAGEQTALPLPRLGIAVIGQGASPAGETLFRHLRPHGTYFSAVRPEDGLTQILAAVEARARANPVPYGHWYVDGGDLEGHAVGLTGVSYRALAPVREALFVRIQKEVARPGMGPEELRDFLARLSPGELGMNGDPVLDRFQVRLLTEGSGTQIFSTSFAQWAARESLRRAEALTLLVRFAPRQRQRPMNELLSASKSEVELDPRGSLIDADMAAYYQWLNQQRLTGAERSAFVVWFEGHNQAVAIGPTLARGTESRSPVTPRALLALATG